MTPRLVALDLDGTVVPYANDYAEPSPRVRRAIERAVAAGAMVTVATGRAVWNALPTVRALGLGGIELVCSNGAVGYDVDSSSVIFQSLFDPRRAARALAECAPDAGFAVEFETEGYLHTAGFVREYPIGYVSEVSFDELIARPTSRMVCRLAGDSTITVDTPLEELRARREAAHVVVRRACLDPREYKVELGYSGWVDIIAPGVSKGTGLAELASRLGITAAETAVIGDATNDLPMFAWAGYSVAMGQAPEAVRAAADETTADVAADGVALILEKWF